MNKHAALNRAFRLVRNETLGIWVPAAETSRARGKRSGRSGAVLAAALAAIGLAAGAFAQAAEPVGVAPPPTELPSGGQVIAGAATLEYSNTGTLNIDQSVQRAIIEWNTFNVGSAAQVNFNQPDASAATLNRVLDSNPSRIFGKIQATGQVFLTNPNGVYFGKSASVDVGGLVASTAQISDADFLSGNVTLRREGSTGSVVNEGELRAHLGGYIALLAPEVRNSGVVVARLGTVAMAAGESFTLEIDGGHLAGLTVAPATIEALVENKGAVLAPGGFIVLSAKALDRLQGGVVNNSGTIEATGLSMKNGRIVLEASDAIHNSGTISANAGVDGSPAGDVSLAAPEIENSGTITATAHADAAQAVIPGAGGSISLVADTISQAPDALLDVSGVTGGTIHLDASRDVTVAGTIAAVGQEVSAAPAPSSAGQGGKIILIAQQDVTLQDALIDASGATRGGEVVARGGAPLPFDPPMDPPAVALLGATQVRTSSRRGRGGNVTMTGDRVGLFDETAIDASGASGGGDVFVGGGFHGASVDIPNAKQVVIGRSASIDTSATVAGDAGDAVVWSDGYTHFAGTIVARGGMRSGDGGAVEVSGGEQLNFRGRVDAGADHGAVGTLLLDPRNIVVASGGGAGAADVDQFVDTPSADATIDPNAITAVTNTGTAVTLQANNDITVSSSIVSNNPGGNGGAITFQAGRSITLNASVTSDNGNVTFLLNDGGADGNRTASTPAVFQNNSLVDAGTGTVTITMGTKDQSGAIGVGQVTAGTFDITHNGPTAGAASGAIDLGEINVTGDLTINANSARDVTNFDGAVVVRGTATINVGAGDVTITRPTTDFSIIGITARNVALRDTNAVQFAATTLSGTLSQTTTGPMASTGPIQVAGTATFIANTGGFGYADPYINFNNPGNHFGGDVTISVPSIGTTMTGGYAIVRDSGAINIVSASLATSLQVTAGGAVTMGSTTAGTSVAITSASGAVNLGTTTTGTSVSINGAGAVDLGPSSIGSDLTITTSGAITDSGTLVVGNQTSLTAGAANDITLDDADNNFNSMRIVTAKDATIVDKTGINFGSSNSSSGGFTSHIYGDLNVTAGGDISQTRYGDADFAAITVDGATVFTANNATTPINLYLGPGDPFNNGGSSNNFAGGVRLARNNTQTGFTNVHLRNTNATASVLTDLDQVGALNNVILRFDNAPAVVLPAMSLAGGLRVYAPGVKNTAGVPGNRITQSGVIVVAGSTIMAVDSTGDIVLNDANNDFYQFGIANTGARNLTIVDKSGIVLYAPGYHQAVTGNWTVTADGDITDVQHNFSVPGTLTLDAGTHNIALTGTNAYLNILAIPSANNVTVYSQNSLVLANVAITGSLTLASRGGGTLTQVASTSVVTGSPSSNTTTFNTYNSGITLNQAGNVFGKLSIADAGAINIRENDAITQANAWGFWNSTPVNTTRYAVALATSDDQAIALDQANFFGNLTITQINNGASAPAGAVYVRETADSLYGLTQGSAWTTHGTVTLDSGVTSINLNNGNNVLGPLRVLGATGNTNSLPSTVTIYAKNSASTDAITDIGGTGAWNTGTGVVKLIAYDTAGTTAGGGNVTLQNAGNVLGDLYVKATDVTITENDSITDGANTIWNGANDTGWMTTGTTRLVVANPASKSITLDNLSNQLGALAINTTGTAGTLTSVLITDNTDLTQAALWNVGAAPVTLDARNHAIALSTSGNVLGAITVNTTNGMPTSVAITEDDAITQGSAWVMSGVPVTLVAENDKAITLTDATNVLGNLTVTGGAVSITENDPITQGGAWTTTGTTTLNAGTAAITLQNADNVLGALAFGGTPSAVSIVENDDITQAGAWVLGATPFVLNAGTHDILLSQAGNKLGDLTLTAQNATVTENDTAGITDGGAWTISGLTTLTAGNSNPIVLNANPASDFGTVSIVSASNADIGDANDIAFADSTIAAGGTLTVTAGGLISQTGAINAPSLRLIGTGSATLNNVGNNVANLAAGFSGGDLEFTGAGTFAVAVVGGTSGVTIGANDVTLTSIGGTITQLSNINASSSSLTLTTGTGLTLPQMSIAGAQTYTAGGTGITLTSGVTSTASGAINFNSPVTLGADLTIQSTNSAINFADTVTGAGNQLIVNAGNGSAAFHGAVSNLGSIGDASPALQLTSSGAVFDSTLGANNGLAVTGPVVFKDSVTLANGNAGSVFTGLVTLGKVGGMSLSGYDGMTFNGGLLLQDGAATITSNNSTLVFQTAGTVSGPYDLTLNSGTAALLGLDFMGSDLKSLTVTAFNPIIPAGGVTIDGAQTYTPTNGSSITLSGDVTSTSAGAITFNGPVIVGASSTVSSADSAITFAGTVDGNKDLTVSSGSGAKQFTGAVGGVTPLGDGVGAAIVLQGAGTTTFDEIVQARSGITAAGPVIFKKNVTLTNGDTGSTFAGLVTTGGTSGNTLSGFDGMAFNGGLALVGGPVSILSNGSTLSFGGAVSGPQDLTLNALAAGAGTVTGLDWIGDSSDLTALSVTAQTLNLPSTGLAVAGPMSFTAAGGITLNGEVGNSVSPNTSRIDFNGPVILATGAITVTAKDDDVTFNGTVNGAQDLTVDAGTGTTTFTGAVGGTNALRTLTTAAGGITALNGPSVRTTLGQTYNDAVTLGADVILTGTSAQFASTVDGAHALTANNSASTEFDGVVGGNTALTSITTDAGGVTSFNGSAVTTSGAQTYNDDVGLGHDVTFTGNGITFGAGLGNTYAATANAGNGALRFLGAVGGRLTSLVASGNTVQAADVATSGAQSYTATGGVTLAGELDTTNGGVTITGPTTLAGNTAITTGGGGNITFSGASSTINGAHDLTLAAGSGNVVLGGVVGGIAPLTALSVSGNNLTLPGISTVNDLNQTYIALGDITLNQSRTVNAPISFTADADSDGVGSFILLNGVSLTASNNTLDISAADLDLQGNSTLLSGSGLMTIAASNGRDISLGGPDAPGQLTITGSELARMSSSGGLALKTTSVGRIFINGITSTQSQNITGTLLLHAQGSGDVSFITAASTFNTLTANAVGGTINVGVNLTTTGDPIEFVTPVAVSGASTISSGGGNITFDDTVAVDNDLILTTSNGALTFAGAVGSNKKLTLNLGGGTVSGLNQLQSALTGLTVNGTAGLTLPSLTIDGAMVFNTGPITITGDLDGIGIKFNNLVDVVPGSGTAIVMNARTGTLDFVNLVSFNTTNMTLTGDELNFARAVTGSGSLLIQPYTNSRHVSVGGSGAPITGLNLTAAELGWLPIGTLSSLTLGRAAGTGTLDIAGALNAPNTPLTLNGGGGITESGGPITSGSLTLYAAGNAINLGNATNAFGAVGINGTPTALTLVNTRDITQLGSTAWALGSAPVTLNAGTHDIRLNNSGNSFGTLALTGADVQVTEADATDLGASTISRDLTITSTGVVTQSAPLTVVGNLNVVTSVAAGDVTLNNTGASSTTIGNTYVGGDYVLTATGDPVSQAAGATLQIRGDMTVSGSSIVLTGAGNLIGGATNLPASNTVVLRQSGVIHLGDRTEAGNLTVISERTNRSFASALIHGDAIRLDNAANNIGGTISVSASTPTISTGADVQTGIDQIAGTSISVAGVASFTAESSSQGSLGIDLTNDGNQFGTLLLSGETVNVKNSAAALTTLGGVVATDLTLTTAGGVAQTGSVKASSSATIEANGSVLLTNLSNDVGTLDVTSGGNAISYVDANSVVVAGLDAGGADVVLTASGSGNVTQAGALSNVGKLTVNAGGNIVLTNAGNAIASLGASTAGTGIQVFDSAGGLTVDGAVRTVGGDMLVRTNGDLTLASGSSLKADGGDLVVSTEGAGNFINNAGASALSVGSGKRWLVYSNTPDLISGAHTVKGGLTSDFRRFGSTFASYAPGSVTELGDGFIYKDAPGTLTVAAAVSGPATHIYGDNPTGSLSYVISAGQQDSEDTAANVITGGTATYTQALSNTMDAGTYTIMYTGGLTSNYSLIVDTDGGATYTVTPAVLLYDADTASRAYGAANPTLSGTVTGFKLGQNASILTGTGSWSTNATLASNVGQYAITGSGYTANSNYTFTQDAGNATALTVTKAGLTVTANEVTRTYDGTAFSGGAGVTISGWANGDDTSVLGGTLAYGGSAQGARNAGSYVVSASGLTAGNYSFSYVDGALTVDRANLTLSTSNVTKTYDGTLSAAGSGIATGGTQIFGGDTVSGGTFAFTNANAGTGNKTVNVSGMTVNDGNGGGNYNVSYAANTSSTINPAAITVRTSDVTKSYDGSLSATGSAVVSSGTLFHNVSNGNAQDSLSGGTFAFTDANAGLANKTVTTNNVTVIDGNGGGNYVVSYANNTTSTIDRAALVFVGGIADKEYDGTTAATVDSYQFSGLVGSETLDVNTAAISATFADKNAADGKVVTLSGVVLANGTNGGLASNYVVSPTASTSGNIKPKVLTVNANVADKVYDGTTTASVQGYGISGYVGSETVIAVGTGSAAFVDKNVGTNKAVAFSGIALVNGTNGGLASNYVIGQTGVSNASITPATLHVVGVVAENKVYDGTLVAKLNSSASLLSGMVGTDDVRINALTGTYATKDVGVHKVIGTGTVELSGADAGNYILVQPLGMFSDITPRDLAVTATGVNKVYDGTTAATVNFADNRVAGDVFAVTGTARYVDANVGTGKYIGVTDISSSGQDAGNYVVTGQVATYADITGTGPTGSNPDPNLDPPGSEPAPNPAPDPALNPGMTRVEWSLPPVVPRVPVVPTTVPPPTLVSVGFTSESTGIDAGNPVGLGGPYGGASGAATGTSAAKSANGVTVTLVDPPSNSQLVRVVVSVPSEMISSGDGFSFVFPTEMAEAAAIGKVSVTLADGSKLPSWLRYVPATHSIVATSVPAGALPIEVLIRIGDARWTVTITARSVH